MREPILSGPKTCRQCGVQFLYEGGDRLCAQCLIQSQKRLDEYRDDVNAEMQSIIDSSESANATVSDPWPVRPSQDIRKEVERKKISPKENQWSAEKLKRIQMECELDISDNGSLISKAVAKYVLHLIQEGCSYEHVSHTKSRIVKIAKGLECHSLDTMTNAAVKQWIDKLTLASRTKQNYREAYSSFKTWIDSQVEAKLWPDDKGWVETTSNNVRSYKYDQDREELRVRFSSSIVIYHDVSHSEYVKFHNTPSKEIERALWFIGHSDSSRV